MLRKWSSLKALFLNRNLIISLSILIIAVSSLLIYFFYNHTNNEQAKKNDFRWDLAKGSEIAVYFSQHPYVEAVINKLPEFEKKTGIKVSYYIIPEESYFDKLSLSLKRFRGPDVFMMGPYYIWEYADKGYIEDLNSFLDKTEITDPDYNIKDFYINVLNSLKWDMAPGHSVGTGGLWGLPMGCEINCLAYNKRIFKEKGLKPPETLEQLLELCKTLNGFNGKGTYSLALRGARNWATINTSFITTYANYGAKDFEIVNGKLVSRMNSEQAIAMTDLWVDLIKTGGAPGWDKYNWYQASADFGAGKAAMLFDSDNVGYYQNPLGESKESGNIAWIKAPLPKGMKKSEAKSNLWTWGLAMNSASENKEATWIFLQYFTGKEFTLWASQNFKLVDPARKSVLESPGFQKVISHSDGYGEVLKDTINNAAIQFTPQPRFFEVSTEWMQTIQDIVLGKSKTTQEGLDKLKIKIDSIVKDINVN